VDPSKRLQDDPIGFGVGASVAASPAADGAALLHIVSTKGEEIPQTRIAMTELNLGSLELI